jgi:hypothetical protein
LAGSTFPGHIPRIGVYPELDGGTAFCHSYEVHAGDSSRLRAVVFQEKNLDLYATDTTESLPSLGKTVIQGLGRSFR